MGVWIETFAPRIGYADNSVTPFVGVWIETIGYRAGHENTFVTPFVGVWIETTLWRLLCCTLRSHPSWVCGLKLSSSLSTSPHWASHPSWVCGLKLPLCCLTRWLRFVTPFVGVWIETVSAYMAIPTPVVTPFVGVWIETSLLPPPP